jgi:hypothetical protein
VLRAATCIALVAGCSAFTFDPINASATPAAGASQSTTDDPCRYASAEAVGKAFGRPMKSSRITSACQYRAAGNDMVVVKVAAGSEGVIMQHMRTATAGGHKGAEKVATTAGEAYFDSILPVFIGRAGNHDVQIETTIEPAPREAMIALGIRIMEGLARK